MNRFFIESFKHEFSLFKTKPIYMLFEQADNTTTQVGKAFTSYKQAVFICDWLNDAHNEYEDKLAGGLI